MYVDISVLHRGNKTYTRALLRESYREGGKVKHRTIANISKCSLAEIEAIQLALRHKDALGNLGSIKKAIKLTQGKSAGAVIVLLDLARRIGLIDALGVGRQASLALWQVMARVIDQGSRLSATRLARTHAVAEFMGLSFDEDDLYANLDWLCEHQEQIEDRLFKLQKSDEGLFLYDVTSSYLEGEDNELAAFGYNRDRKSGKRQVVVGLLCNGQGQPLSIEVFEGNTQDPKTLLSQVKKVADRFGGGEVTFVGDRGMIKGHQIETLGEEGFHYITAVTKPTIERLLAEGTLQMGLFDNDLAEIEDAGLRYVLRRNPQRQQEMSEARRDRQARFQTVLDKGNAYLADHPRAKVSVTLRKIEDLSKRLGLASWLEIKVAERVLSAHENPEVLEHKTRLDGCYVLKTDLPTQCASKELIHSRYKDLAQVEWAFRTAKTTHLEMRPIYVRLASRTRGHALVVMLAYRLVQELRQRWNSLDMTVEEGITLLSQLCLIHIAVTGQPSVVQLPKPAKDVEQLLDLAGVRLPSTIPPPKGKVSTKKHLQTERKSN